MNNVEIKNKFPFWLRVIFGTIAIFLFGVWATDLFSFFSSEGEIEGKELFFKLFSFTLVYLFGFMSVKGCSINYYYNQKNKQKKFM